MEALPYADDSFDLVAGFNSFFFADDMVAALSEARRVARPGAPVVIQVWGRPEHCELTPMKHAAAPFLPPRPSDAPAPPALWKPGVLEGMARAAGLQPGDAFDLTWSFAYADEDALVRGLTSAGGIAALVPPEQHTALGAAIREALTPYRTPDGTYRLANEWHYLIARA
jgi:SAM-dependent methyltransferase